MRKRRDTRRLTAACALLATSAMITCATLAIGAETQPTTWSVRRTVNPDQPDISGVWRLQNFSPIVMTIDGKEPPLQPWAKELREKRLMAAKDGRPYADTESYCLTGGMPRVLMGAPYPVQILQTPGQVTMLFENLHDVRYIYLDEKHVIAEDLDPSYLGDSVARWEGDTLVVDTIGLTDRTTLDKYGTPHTDQLHIVEHIRRLDEKTLEVVITFEDPKTFTSSWKHRAVYALQPKGAHLAEYYCENNRNLPDKNGEVTFK